MNYILFQLQNQMKMQDTHIQAKLLIVATHDISK